MGCTFIWSSEILVRFYFNKIIWKIFYKFSSILTARTKLIDENNALAKQNDELRLLLSKYMQSKVNQELQIPPSQIIQLQLAEQSSSAGGY
jgi:regulator of replication initiation timing